jgi:hypothetical protein
MSLSSFDGETVPSSNDLFCPCANFTVIDGNNDVGGGDIGIGGQPFRDTDYFSEEYRYLQDAESSDVPSMSPSQQAENYILWEVIYTSVVLLFMFAALISDKIGADSVMLISLTLFMVAGIVTVSQGVAGFANEGLLTVMVLFIVASGISKTGALVRLLWLLLPVLLRRVLLLDVSYTLWHCHLSLQHFVMLTGYRPLDLVLPVSSSFIFILLIFISFPLDRSPKFGFGTYMHTYQRIGTWENCLDGQQQVHQQYYD